LKKSEWESYRWKKAIFDHLNIIKLSHDIRIALLDNKNPSLKDFVDLKW
jgi:hypothetical protein